MATQPKKPSPSPDHIVPAAGKHAARPSEADRIEALQQEPPAEPLPDAALPPINDPGGARTKGYSPDANAARPAPPDGPIPLATDQDIQATVQKPKDKTGMPPTCRTGATDYTPNDRMMGSHG